MSPRNGSPSAPSVRSRRLRAVVGALGSAALLLIGFVQPAAAVAGPGAITGTVSVPAGQAVTGVTVTVTSQSDWSFAGGTSVEADGTFVVGDLPAGTYTVGFDAPGLLSEYWQDASDWDDALAVVVEAGQETSLAGTELELASSIGGIVTGPAGVDLTGVTVWAEATDLTTTRMATVGPDGAFEVAGLEAGSYTITFDTSGSSTGLVREYWQDALRREDATAVTVGVDEHRTGIDAHLEEGGSVTGHVSVPDGQNPQSVSVVASPPGGAGGVSALVDADGDYRLVGLPTGEYVVEFVAWESGLMTEFWDGASSRAEATPVHVVVGEETAGIDAALELGGTLAGTVTVPAGHDVTQTSVFVSDDTTGVRTYGYPAADGSYAVGGLPTGSYEVSFTSSDPDLVGEYWPGVYSWSAAQPVDVTRGAVTGGIDVSLDRGGTISGAVTVPDGFAPTAVSVTASESSVGARQAEVAVDGTFRVRGLAPGSYRVHFAAPHTDLLPEYWDDEPLSADAELVDVAAGADVVGVDAQLTVAGSISGRVLGADGPLADVGVSAQPLDGGETRWTTTGVDGTYRLTGLRGGDHRIDFMPSPTSSYLWEYYDDATELVDAESVPVDLGEETRDVDATVSRGAEVGGVVTGPDGSPVAGVEVSVVEHAADYGTTATTDSEGRYRVTGIRPGEYLLRFSTPLGSELAGMYWPAAYDDAAATRLSLAAEDVHAGLDVRLAVGATISGTVSTSDGSPVVGANVSTLSAQVPRVALTDDAGTYTIRGVAPGAYGVLVEPYDDPYLLTGAWSDSSTGADELTVALGTTYPGTDVVLGAAATVGGTVSVPSGMTSYCVTAWTADTGQEAGRGCAAAGEDYLVGHLPTGSYRLSAMAHSVQQLTDTVPLYHPGKRRLSQALPVAVVGGALTSVVDMDLASVEVQGTAVPEVTVSLDPPVPTPGSPTAVAVSVGGDLGPAEGVVEVRSARGLVGDAVLVGGSAAFTHTFTSEDGWLDVAYRGTSYASGYAWVEPELGTAPRTATSTELTSSANPAEVGRPVTLTTTVSSAAGVPAGAVDLSAHGDVIATVELEAGVATATLPDLPVGMHEITAEYLGSATHAGSSGTLLQEIRSLAVPLVSHVEPPSGSVLGGTRVTLTGTGLTGATAVTFGGVPGTAVEVVSAGLVRVTAPAGAKGAVPIVVTTPAGASAAAPGAQFTYIDAVARTPERTLTNGAVTPNVVRCHQVAGAAGVADGATGVILNVTAVRPDGPGYVVVYPDTQGDGRTPPPLASTVNFEAGQDVANSAFVDLPDNGRVCFVTRGAAHVGVILDVVGFTLPGSGIVTLEPERLLDTRGGAYRVGTIAGPVAPRKVHTVKVAGEAGVPEDATAVLLNVTVTGPTTPGNLRVFPAGQPVPTTSVVNFAAGRDKANGTIVALPASGEISFYSDSPASTGVSPVNVILDVVGYVTADASYTGVTPTRVLDTRGGTGHVGPIPGVVAARTVYSVPVGGTEHVPAGATAVVLNVTAIGPTSIGNLRVYPDSDGTGRTPPPNASSLNYIPGRDIPNQVVVALPANGKINFYSDQPSGGVHVAADLVGYLSAD